MKKFTLITLLVFIWGIDPAGAQSDNSVTAGFNGGSTIHTDIQLRAAEIFDDLVLVRRDFHMHPELSGQEKRTSDKIAQYLTDLGLEVKTNIGGFGVVGILRGAKEGKKIAWRADIDALPINAENVVDFKSKNTGVGHLCGHDVHTTIALGIANVLAGLKEGLKGTIYFVFQPSEENLQGAKAMMDDGLFEIINPDEMYALHVTPFPAGLIATKSDELFADFKKLKITFKKTKRDTALLDFAKRQIQNLQTVEPDSKFWDKRNVGDPEIGIAGSNSIYKNYTIISGDIEVEEDTENIYLHTFISTSNKAQRDRIVPYIRSQFNNSEFSDELLNVEYLSQTPTLLNDEKLSRESLESLASIYGTERIIQLTGVVADGRSDDFALFQDRVPTVYFFLGGSDFEKGIISQPHSPGFMVDEKCIGTGVEFFSSLIIERLLAEEHSSKQ